MEILADEHSLLHAEGQSDPQGQKEDDVEMVFNNLTIIIGDILLTLKAKDRLIVKEIQKSYS